MKISKQLQSQLDRLRTQGAFALNRVQKIELQQYADYLGARPLKNLDCATCVRDTIHSVNDITRRKTETPILQKRMTMVKTPNELSWGELKTFAKAKGISTYKKTKQDILNELSKIK